MCETIKIGNTTAIICGGRHRHIKCYSCGELLNEHCLCDYPIGKYKNGKAKTCDRKMCFDCTQKGASGETDFCKIHYPLAKAAYERREARKLFSMQTV